MVESGTGRGENQLGVIIMLSHQSVCTLVDILENRISVMEVTDRDDMRELSIMKKCLAELANIGGGAAAMATELEFASVPRRGRRRKMHA